MLSHVTVYPLILYIYIHILIINSVSIMMFLVFLLVLLVDFLGKRLCFNHSLIDLFSLID